MENEIKNVNSKIERENFSQKTALGRRISDILEDKKWTHEIFCVHTSSVVLINTELSCRFELFGPFFEANNVIYSMPFVPLNTSQAPTAVKSKLSVCVCGEKYTAKQLRWHINRNMCFFKRQKFSLALLPLDIKFCGRIHAFPCNCCSLLEASAVHSKCFSCELESSWAENYRAESLCWKQMRFSFLHLPSDIWGS